MIKLKRKMMKKLKEVFLRNTGFEGDVEDIPMFCDMELFVKYVIDECKKEILYKERLR